VTRVLAGVSRGEQQLDLDRAGGRKRAGVGIDPRCGGRRAMLAPGEAERGEAEQRPPSDRGGRFHRAQSAIRTSLRIMAATTAASLRPLVEPVVTAAGYDLEDLVVKAAGRRSVVQVLVDRDGGIDLDEVADVSRAVSDALDAGDAFGESAYTLEVSSPGVDRPLTEPRHWRRNVGRLVETQAFKGRIIEATDDGVAVEVKGETRQISYSDLGPGKIIVEFSR
jgi:ribosome maturation factor RimP